MIHKTYVIIKEEDDPWSWFLIVDYVLILMNSSINIFIYCLVGESVKDVLLKICSKQQTYATRNEEEKNYMDHIKAAQAKGIINISIKMYDSACSNNNDF